MISREYAVALFQQCTKPERTLVMEWFHLIEDIVEELPQYVDLMRSPNVTDEVKQQLITEAFSDAPATFLHFLYVVLDQDRFGEMTAIASEYQTLLYEEEDVMVVQAITAKPLEDAVKEDLVTRLSKVHGKEIILQERSQPDVIGGLRLEFQGNVIDQSIQTQVQRLQQSLRKGS